MTFSGTFDDAAMNFFSHYGASDGTQGDRRLAYWISIAVDTGVTVPDNATVSDVLRMIADALSLPQTTVNEIEMVICELLYPPIDSGVYNDLLKAAYVSV